MSLYYDQRRWQLTTTCRHFQKNITFLKTQFFRRKTKTRTGGGCPLRKLFLAESVWRISGVPHPLYEKKSKIGSIWLLPSDRVDYSWQSEADSQRVTFNNSCDFLLTLISPLESLWSPFKGGDLACYVFHAGSFDIKVSISFFLFEQQCDELICFRTNQC